jgi:hypothetical protein
MDRVPLVTVTLVPGSLVARLRASLPSESQRQLQVIDTISQTIMLHRAVEDASTGSDSDYSK